MVDCILELKMMVFCGVGRCRLKSALDVVKAPFRCSVCQEKFARIDALKQHLCRMHPDKIGLNLKVLLEKIKSEEEA